MQQKRPLQSLSILSFVPCGAASHLLSAKSPRRNHRTRPLIRSTLPLQASSSVWLQEASTEPIAIEEGGIASLDGASQMSAAEGCLRFINYAWTQFHAVGEHEVFLSTYMSDSILLKTCALHVPCR